jgi:hypothetical protein
MNRLVQCIAAIALLVATSATRAETHRVDDSRSQVLGTSLRLKPIGPLAHGNRMNIVTGTIDVIVRLDVSRWKARKGRIYMTLPDQSAGSVTATWTTRGQLLPGAVRNGGRTLVYAGLVGSDMLEDTLRLTLQGDERHMPFDKQLAFGFEIDLDSP